MSYKYCIADDAHFFRELIKHSLRGSGGTCLGEACDGAEAVEMVKKMKPDVLILDLVMPVLNGFDVMKMVRKINPDIKVIICSTVDQDFLIKKAYDNGANLYLTKPFKKEVLLKSIQDLLVRTEAVNE